MEGNQDIRQHNNKPMCLIYLFLMDAEEGPGGKRGKHAYILIQNKIENKDKLTHSPLDQSYHRHIDTFELFCVIKYQNKFCFAAF